MPTIKRNESKWNKEYGWEQKGNEWSSSFGSNELQWHLFLFPRLKNFIKTGNIVEIAPGFGRWTSFMKEYATNYIGVNLSMKCTNACSERFGEYKNMRFYTNDGKSLDMLPDNSVDFLFSIDSLVHADKDAIGPYIKEISKKMKEKTYAIIHHSNLGEFANSEKIDNPHWRSTEVSHKYIQKLCDENGLTCV